MGIVGGLPEDLQWTIRMLLPKPPPCAPATATTSGGFLHCLGCLQMCMNHIQWSARVPSSWRLEHLYFRKCTTVSAGVKSGP